MKVSKKTELTTVPGRLLSNIRFRESMAALTVIKRNEPTESATACGNTILNLTNQFAAAGFSMHLDDFGTGVSSLSSLTTMPFEVIKMDKSLTDQIGTSKGNVLIQHLIMIVHEIVGHVVAESVKKANRRRFL